jgi:hypothetical protein
VTDNGGYRRPRIYAAAAITAVVCVQSLAEIVLPTYRVTSPTLVIELLFITALLGLEAVDLFRGR